MRLRAILPGVGVGLVLLALAAPRAQMPRVAAFIYNDSLAVTVDCAPLLTGRRVEDLQKGYPLSFILKFTLRRHDPIWFDPGLLSWEARFRIVHQKLSQDYRFEIRDLSGATTVVVLEQWDDIEIELEERLFATVAHLSDLDPEQRYYVALNVEYRNLTFEDVRSSERWLREGRAEVDSVTEETGRSLGEKALGLLWELAGLRGERHEVATSKFRLAQLRRLE